LSFAYLVCILYTQIGAPEPIDGRQAIRRLRAVGRYQVAQRGSRVQFKHPSTPDRVTVPHPRHDLPVGTVRSIVRQAGPELR